MNIEDFWLYPDSYRLKDSIEQLQGDICKTYNKESIIKLPTGGENSLRECLTPLL